MLGDEEEVDEVNVFVKHLPTSVNDVELRRLFTSFGVVVSAKVMVDVFTGGSLGFGFVRFKERGAAQKALKGMTGFKLGNKTLLCKLSNQSLCPDPSTNLYIKPLLSATTEDDLRDLFASFGDIQNTKIVKDKITGDSKGVGFVRFYKQADATEALEKMNGFKPYHGYPCLIVKYAESDLQRITRNTNPPFSTGEASPALHQTNYYTYPSPAYPSAHVYPSPVYPSEQAHHHHTPFHHYPSPSSYQPIPSFVQYYGYPYPSPYFPPYCAPD